MHYPHRQKEVPQSVAGFQQRAATLSASAAPGWSELRFTVRVRVTYTLDFEALEEKCKISNIFLILLTYGNDNILDMVR